MLFDFIGVHNRYHPMGFSWEGAMAKGLDYLREWGTKDDKVRVYACRVFPGCYHFTMVWRIPKWRVSR